MEIVLSLESSFRIGVEMQKWEEIKMKIMFCMDHSINVH